MWLIVFILLIIEIYLFLHVLTGAIEGQYFPEHGNLVRFSEQNLIDCVADCGCTSCSLAQAYWHVKDHGINTVDQYPKPYTQKDGYCRFNSSNYTKIAGILWIARGDEEKLKEAIATVGPISVEIDAHHESFMHYSSGIYYEPRCRTNHFTHAVLAVGYGTSEHGEDYYILKNWYLYILLFIPIGTSIYLDL